MGKKKKTLNNINEDDMLASSSFVSTSIWITFARIIIEIVIFVFLYNFVHGKANNKHTKNITQIFGRIYLLHLIKYISSENVKSLKVCFFQIIIPWFASSKAKNEEQKAIFFCFNMLILI